MRKIRAPTLRQNLSRASARNQYQNSCRGGVSYGYSTIVPVKYELNDDCERIYTRSKPYIASVTGDPNPSFDGPFYSFSVSKPECCTLIIETDCGTIEIPKNICDWSSCDFITDIGFESISLSLSDEDSPECMDSVTIYVCGVTTEEVDPPTQCPIPMPPFNDDPCAYERSRNPCCPDSCSKEEV